MSDLRDLQLVIGSRAPIVTIETHEEDRALRLVASVAGRLGKALRVWTVTDGLRSQTYPSPARSLSDELQLKRDAGASDKASTDPATALRLIKNEPGAAVFVLLDFHAHLADPIIVRLIKEIAQNHTVRDHTLVFISHELTVPAELTRLCARFELSLPDAEAIKTLIHDEAEIWQKTNETKVRADRKAVDRLVSNLLGLTLTDCARLIRNAIRDDGAILADDVEEIAKAKYELIGKDGVLSFEYETAHLSDVGGLRNLKQWLSRRHNAFVAATTQDQDRPKGILLVGVQGGGKSLAAKAVAGVWGVPLLRLDFGVLYNKFFGETEKNIREALKTAELMSPCVLWMDEIEKGIATGDYDSGTSRRVLATLLTWMTENRARVFIVATANDIERLPPELIRKGRLDEIFFVDLPDEEARAEIASIHLKRRGFDPAKFNLKQIAQATAGFSGAEIEQAVVSARYAMHEHDVPLETAHVLQEAAQTKPLSVVMADAVQSLREWSRGRTVSAS